MEFITDPTPSMITKTTSAFASSKRYNAVQFLTLCGYTYEELSILTDSELFVLEGYEDNKLWEDLQ
jgi:hypothetical protein